jgi:hypothetical protein
MNRRLDFPFRPSYFVAQPVLHVNQRLHGPVGKKDGVKYHVFIQFSRTALYHDHRRTRPGNHQVHCGFFQLRLGRIEHISAVHITDPGRGNRTAPGDIGNSQGE